MGDKKADLQKNFLNGDKLVQGIYIYSSSTLHLQQNFPTIPKQIPLIEYPSQRSDISSLRKLGGSEIRIDDKICCESRVSVNDNDLSSVSNTDTWPMDVSLPKPLVLVSSLSITGDFLVFDSECPSRSRVCLKIR